MTATWMAVPWKHDSKSLSQTSLISFDLVRVAFNIAFELLGAAGSTPANNLKAQKDMIFEDKKGTIN